MTTEKLEKARQLESKIDHYKTALKHVSAGKLVDAVMYIEKGSAEYKAFLTDLLGLFTKYKHLAEKEFNEL